LFFIVQLVRGFAENRNHFPLMTHTSAYSFIRVARGADDTVEQGYSISFIRGPHY